MKLNLIINPKLNDLLNNFNSQENTDISKLINIFF